MNPRSMRPPSRAASPATPAGGPPPHAPNAALLIDFDNVTMGIRSDLQTELRNLLSSDIVKGKVAVQRAYADWRRYPQYILPLTESSIDLIFAPAYGSSKKNATDIRLAVDAIELVFTRPEIGTFILLSGDSDFSSMVIKLKEYGKYVIGVGIRESSSDLLVMNCDEYYSYNALAGLVKSNEDEPAKKYDPWELVSEAIARMRRNGDVMRSDRLKQVMVELDPSFDEKNLGMAKFSRFVQEAAARGLVVVTKLENGQLEVTPPGAAASAPAAEAPRADRAERHDRGDRPERTDRPDRPERTERPDRPERTDRPVAPRAEEAEGTEAERERDREGRRRRGRGRGRDRDRGERGDREPRLEGEERPGEAPRTEAPRTDAPRSDAPRAAAPAREAGDDIGLGGERLTRSEAFDLVRRATESLVSGDAATSARVVRQRAFELLGRDSESLSERNFTRILKDAHDGDVIDLRRRGDDFEVAAIAAAPVADQLREAAAAVAPSPAASAPVAPRGMGPRGAGPGRRGSPIGRGAPPPELLMIGVVDAPATAISAPAAATPTPAPASAPAVAVDDNGVAPAAAIAETPAPAAKKAARGGRGGGRAPAAAKKGAAKPAPKPREGKAAAPAEAAAPAAAKKKSAARRGGGGGARVKKTGGAGA